MRYTLGLPLLAMPACSSLGSAYWSTGDEIPIRVAMNISPTESCSEASTNVSYPTANVLGMTIRNASGQPLGVSFEAADGVATENMRTTAEGLNVAAGGSSAGGGGTLEVRVRVEVFCDDAFPAAADYETPLIMHTIDEDGSDIESLSAPVVVALTRDP